MCDILIDSIKINFDTEGTLDIKYSVGYYYVWCCPKYKN